MSLDHIEDIRQDVLGTDVITFTGEYLDMLEVIYHDKLIPIYWSSVGAHILNLLNNGCSRGNGTPPDYAVNGGYCHYYGDGGGKDGTNSTRCFRVGFESLNWEYLMKFGQVPDLRLHVMHVAPSGFSKDMFMDFFTNHRYGFLNLAPHKQIVPNIKLLRTTEAGYAGSINEKGEKLPGLAKKYCAGLIAIPEYHIITAEGKMQYSSQIEDELLEVLEKGELNKNMAKTSLSYYSYHTLWAGTQPGIRFDVSSGLGRRLNFFVHTPSPEEMEEYTNAQKSGYDKSDQPRVIGDYVSKIRSYVRTLWENARLITDIQFTQDYKDFRDKVQIVKHTDLSLLDNLAMGYNFMVNFRSGDKTPILKVEIDDRLKLLMNTLSAGRKKVAIEHRMEWEILSQYLNRPKFFYDVVKEVNESTLMTRDDSIEKLKSGLAQGVFGMFIYYDKDYGARKQILFDSITTTIDEARKEYAKDHDISVEDLMTVDKQ